MLYQRNGRRRVSSQYTKEKVRGMSIMSIPGKIYGRVLISRMMESTKEQVAEKQEGFGSGWECIDQIFVLKQLVEKCRKKGNKLHVSSMDLEKAYDTVRREELWRMLHEFGFDGYLIRSMSSLYEGSRACGRLGSRVGNILK